ncbi:hypothetical protein FTW19_18860 [Terriglobus albidus]|uniref:WD40 repeat domain-containing protein n=1 Tax=Terriglobus albidus TaxID=1592106 RepID=A0A5B9EIC2_9BACT|nr:hypothetical protein [Terriglobus albidus]QEE29856.1 hypothetical protein FTW19_18860 [Terriglobus albidus]
MKNYLMIASMGGILVFSCLASAQSGDLYPPPIQEFHPGHITSTTARWKDRRIRVLGSSRLLKLEIKSNTKRTTVPLPEELAEVDELAVSPQGRVLVRGMLDGASSMVVIVDAVTGKVVDSIWCYLPAISPDANNIAFIKFYPTHGAAATDRYMLYRVDQSPSENRSPDVPRTDSVNVGRAILPLNGMSRPYDNLGKFDVTGKIESRSRLLWSKDSHELAFAVSVDNALLMERFTLPGRGTGRHRVASLDTHDVCAEGELDTKGTCPVLITDLAWSPTGLALRLTQVGRATKTLTLTDNQFLLLEKEK